MKISLHRVIAEIKNLENKLSEQKAIVSVATKKDQMVGTQNKQQFESTSQAAIDQFSSDLKRLQKLKVARNLMNATTQVVVNGRTMTIDEALAVKATLPIQQAFIHMIKAQMNNASVVVSQASAEVERKIEAQVSAIGGSTKKITEEELKTIRNMMEKSTGKEIVMGSNVAKFLEEASKEIETFQLEIDFALSEVNAKTEVEIPA